jgi:hypothetical protein
MVPVARDGLQLVWRLARLAGATVANQEFQQENLFTSAMLL